MSRMYYRCNYFIHPLNRLARTVAIRKCYKTYEKYLKLIRQAYLHIVPTYQIHIRMYHIMTKIDISNCRLYELPIEFKRLSVLKTCDLSDNRFNNIPIMLSELKCIENLHIKRNYIKCLPYFLNNLPKLKSVDVYDNEISDVFCSINEFKSFDMALNFIYEPDTDLYAIQKKSLREKIDQCSREDGRKDEYSFSTSEPSSDTYVENLVSEEIEEFWDDEDGWEPNDYASDYRVSSQTIVDCFIEGEMKKGHFCPIDMHVPRVSQQNKSSSPFEIGQFDNASSDECDI